MFFLHALATRIRDLEKAGDDAALAKLPLVTCYEMSEGPGGIWRSDKKHVARKHNPNMYDTLWINVPKELTEFADYTYEEHFGGKQTPAFLPRCDVLEYMLKRTTTVDADLYRRGIGPGSSTGSNSKKQRRHEVRFCTTVQNVVYNETTKKFEVTSCHTAWENEDDNKSNTDSTSVQPSPAVMEQYDYCIWAAGRQGKPRIPRPLLDLLRSGVAPYDEDDQDSISTPTSKDEMPTEPPVPFKGTILHSSHMDGFEENVKGKRVVLIGDSSSAEDLALKAIRDGAEMVYILSRSGYGDAIDMGAWPGTVDRKTGKVKSKVKALIALPYQVVNNGTNLRCCEIFWNQDDEIYEIDDEEEPFTLERIDTIIFCTGYSPNLDCLDPSLRFPEHEDCFWTTPPNYAPAPNSLSEDVVPSEELDLSSRVIPGVCRNSLISNRRMMYLTDADSETPLFEIDVAAWLCLSQITGDTPVLGRNEMEREVQQHMLEEMDHPYLRWEMDMNYFEALNQLPDDHWSNDPKDSRSQEIVQKLAEYYTKAVARNMRLAKYPVDFGTFDKLNDDGRKHVQLYISSCDARISLERQSEEAEWKTYRDFDPNRFRSIFTGQEACALPKHWLALEKDGEAMSFGKTTLSATSTGRGIEALIEALSVEASSDQRVLEAPTVAVIGCGPSGMFFLHALATRRKKLADANDADGLAVLPQVTCFEMSEGPGGIWRPQSDSKDEAHYPNIYDDLWSNKPKELIEFADYTFEKHFGGAQTPVYLPKDNLFDYMLKRTTTVDDKLFDEVKFKTTVENVVFNSATEKFELLYCSTGGMIKEQYDYCIWAAGQHAKPRIPRQLIRLLRTGRSTVGLSDSSDEEGEENGNSSPFKGTVLHSSHMSNFEASVRNKTVVLIGDSDSAEDCALHAVKVGVESVHILSRSGYGICKETGSWPGACNKESGEFKQKVHVHLALPYQVINNGSGLKCALVEWDQKDGVWQRNDETPPIQLDNVDTIIFCTGYMSNQDCLSADLQLKDLDHDYEESFWVAPPDFEMRPNALQSDIGNIEPSEELDFSSNIIPGVYRNVLIKNPRMMYLASLDNTLLELDVAAWLCLAYITGDTIVPSKEEMEREIQEQMIEEMHIPYLRWEMDMNYFEALDKLGGDHWHEDSKDSRTRAIDEEHARYLAKLLARNMRSAKYLVDFGSYDSLNEKGEKFVQIELQNDYARRMLDAKGPEAEWKTYRDVDPIFFRSIYTGQPAAPLPCHWLNLDRDGKNKTGSSSGPGT